MPKRGSAQFLLLSSRPRAMLGWGIGAAAIVFFLMAGLVFTKDEFPLLAKTGLAQALRQSVWQQALAGQGQPEHWPWDETSAKMSLVPAIARVPRLGLSAAILKRAADTQGAPARHLTDASGAKTRNASPEVGDVAIGDGALGHVAIGDSITLTSADGTSHVYKITGRRVVDPHLAGRDSALSDAKPSRIACWPLEAIQATKTEPPAAPQRIGSQQKQL
jgi:hypothetical protein